MSSKKIHSFIHISSGRSIVYTETDTDTCHGKRQTRSAVRTIIPTPNDTEM